MTKSYIIEGLGFGDEGKGTTVDYLRDITGIETIIRYNGGSQAAHHVVANNVTHCFSQFGSASLSKDVQTYLSECMLIDPLSMDAEEEVLRSKGVNNLYDRLSINENALVITPFHKIVGQMRELEYKRGSCGKGVGETVKDSKIWKNSIRVGDLLNENLLDSKLDFFWRVKLDQAEQIAQANNNPEIKERCKQLSDSSLVKLTHEYYVNFISGKNIVSSFEGPAIYEGAQGVLLDPIYGFSPYVTKTRTTFENADKILKNNEAMRLGILRAYLTRHGAGPFVTEDSELNFQELHNLDNKWQGRFRMGWMDILAVKYSINVSGGIDGIALTNLDRFKNKAIRVCIAYEYHGKERLDDFFEYNLLGGKSYINKIKIRSQEDGKISKLFGACKPVYRDFHDIESYLDFLESADGLAVPVKIVSYGPDRKDKVLRGSI
jgi:adenylosuccinate synthase